MSTPSSSPSFPTSGLYLDGAGSISRRRFLASTAGALVLASGAPPSFVQAEGAQTARRLSSDGPEPWYRHAWRRAVIDMHIPDWDPQFLSQFDPDEYVEALVTSRAQSVVLYAHSHVGLFNYPTNVGQQHRGLGGRDLVSELIERCHRQGIACVLYASVIHDRWASDEHPEWRIIHPNGGVFGEGSRHGFVCPNSPYREYVRAWAREMAERFDLDGLRFDMTFWTCVCHCEHCRKRWADEVGGALPRVVDWSSEEWVGFQMRREAWLGEFAGICTQAVKGLKPNASVEHQASTYPLSWNNGVASPLLEHNDFLQGDFYGDALQGSFVRKLLASLTPNRPAGFETSFSVSLQDHTARKSEALLEAKASAALADGAAFIYIDAIDPIGSVNPHAHARMGRVFDRLMPLYDELGGDRVMDVGVYHSLESKFDPRQNGRSVVEVDNGADSHTHAAMEAARCLLSNHMLFGVVTRRNLSVLPNLKTLLLSQVHHMAQDEVEAIRAWVHAGGTLYASAGTSLITPQGRRCPDFQLADVFGVSLQRAVWRDRHHYLAPTDQGAEFFGEWSVEYPAFVPGTGFDVSPKKDAVVLATRSLPWPAPNPREFSSIHSDPPWRNTAQAEVVLHPFGNGLCIYSASPMEDHRELAPALARLVRRLTGPQPTLECDTHPSVEITLFRQPERNRYLLSLATFQCELPNLPVPEVKVTLRLEEKVQRIERLPRREELRFEAGGQGISFTLPSLDGLQLLAVRYA